MKKIVVLFLILCVGFAIVEYDDGGSSYSYSSSGSGYSSSSYSGGYSNTGRYSGGSSSSTSVKSCSRCYGSGTIDCVKCAGGSCKLCAGIGIVYSMGNRHVCTSCKGTSKCNKCGGIGELICPSCR